MTVRRLALALMLAPLAAGAAPLDNLVEACANPNTKPHDALVYCRNALEKRGMEKQPDEVKARVLLNAGIAALNLGRYREAVSSQTRALTLQPTLGQAYLGRAQAYRRLGQNGAAMSDYEAAIRYAPDEANAWLGRGTLRLRAGDRQGALADFDRAVSLRPEWTDARYNRGAVLLALGDFARAEADFSTVLAQEPEDIEALINRGKARAALRHPQAAADFDRAVELRPEWGGGWFARGQFRDSIGRREAANADYMRAYQLGHSDPRLIERVQQIGGG